MRTHRIVSLGLVLGLVVTLAGCASPVAPTPPRPHNTLTVYVLDYRDQATPLAGATVSVHRADGVDQATTDRHGAVVFDEPIDVDLTVRAAAPGFVDFAAESTIGGAETWTFWLEPDAAAAR